MNIFDKYLDKIKKILLDLSKNDNLILPNNLDGITAEIPPLKFNSDISTNVAMVLSKLNKKSPIDLANILVEEIKKNDEMIESILVVKPGFINIKFKPIYWTNFVEEIIRLETPVQSLFRRVRKEVNLEGVSIPEGSIIDMRFGSANRDSDQFKCPAQMDLKRKNPGKHLAYGVAHHHCIGAPLARQEMRMAFELLLSRLKNIKLTPNKNDFLHHPHFALRGLKELHLTFEKNS